jgi:hypothetical protein
MTLTVTNNTNSTNVATRGDHAQIASVELDEVSDFSGGDVQNDGVIDLEQ